MNALRKWLVASSFKPGDRLPSERELVGRLGIKHNTVNRAMNRLISEGLIRREGYRLFYVGTKEATLVSLNCDLVIARASRLLPGFRKIAKELGVTLRIHSYSTVVDAVRHLHTLDVPTTESVVFDPPHSPAASVWAPAMSRLLHGGIPAVVMREFCETIPCVAANYARAVDLAFRHLREAGHEEIALIMVTPRSPVTLEIYAAWQVLGRQNGARPGMLRVAFYSDPREDIRALAKKFSGVWKNVTALIVYSEYEPVAPHLVEELAREKRHVPRDLSLISLGDFPYLATAQPPITSVAFDVALMQETLFRLVQRLERKKQSSGLLLSASSLRVEPHLLLRKSTAPVNAGWRKARELEELTSDHIDQDEHADDPNSPDFKRTLRALLRRPYSFTMTAEASRFASIDLTPFVNRPLNFRKGWLGDLPLKQLSAGKHVIHGIHFNVLGGKSRADRGVVVFRSTINETGSAQKLPDHLRIPINSHARAIYVLHGCGYARALAPFATYYFYAGSKCLGSLPLVALGKPTFDNATESLDTNSAEANIQDWWPDFPHRDFTSARRAPILEIDDQDVLQSHVYLYTLEWKNPSPNLKITHMEIRADATQSTTLGLIAISVLKKAVG